MAAVTAADVASKFPRSGAFPPGANPPEKSGAATTSAPAMAMRIPASCFRVGVSLRTTAEMIATPAGCMFTRVTDAAIVVRWIDAFHAQKWSARQMPATTASPRSGDDMRRQSRHSPVTGRRTAMMISENPRRQTAIATGSAAESRTSGPANEIPSRASARTQNGFLDMSKKKEPVRSAPALLKKRTLVGFLGFDQTHLRRGTTRVLEHGVVVPVTVRSIAAADATVVAEERDASVRGATHRFLENLDTVTDVALDVEQVRRAASPLSTVERHDLHQAARADRAAG